MTTIQQFKIKNTVKYPTSIIVNGLTRLGLEIAESLVEQGGYVILIDSLKEENINRLLYFPEREKISFVDYSSIIDLEDQVRRVDYVFFLGHDDYIEDDVVSTQDFLTFSNYLDAMLSLTAKFEAKFLLTTSIKRIQNAYTLTEKQAFVFKGKKAKSHTYTNDEIQKYAEGLTLEYHEKAELNTRILRVGEIIGDAIHLNKDTVFNTLVKQAAREEQLLLEQDGLGKEWLIHLTDCAYGILKGMFSKKSNGAVFSLAYETVLTHLSLAYKIQEAEENAKEIRFVDSSVSTIPPITAYAGAPNLSEIGWQPRVSLDKAIKQSIAAAKLYVLETFQQVGNKEISEDTLVDSATNELQAASRRIQISKKRDRNAWERFIDGTWSRQKRLSEIFTFVERVSPLQLALIIVFVPLFILFYLLVVSPLLYITGNTLLYYRQVEALSSTVNNFDLSETQTVTNAMLTNVQNINETLQAESNVLNYVLTDAMEDVLREVTDLELYRIGAIDKISQSVSALGSIIDNYAVTATVVNASNNLLEISVPSRDYAEELATINNQIPFAEAGLIQLESNNLEVIAIPVVLEEFDIQMRQLIEQIKDFSFIRIIPELLGHETESTFAIFVLDNTRLTPLGGSISTVGIVSFNEGVITDMQIQSVHDIDFDILEISNNTLELINQRRFIPIQSESIEFQDFVSIGNLNTFTEEINPILENTFNREIDGAFFFNLSTISQLLSYRNSTGDNESVEILGITPQEASFLLNINSLQSVNPSVVEKDNNISEIFIKALAGNINALPFNINSLSKVLSEAIETNQFQAYATKNKLNTAFSEVNIDDSQLLFSDFYIDIAINNSNPTVVNVPRYTTIPVSYAVEINDDFSTSQTISFEYPDWGATQEISICLPNEVLVSTIESNVPLTQRTVNQGISSVCIILQALTGFTPEIIVSFDTLPFFTTFSRDKNLRLLITKPEGTVNSNVTFEINNQTLNEISLLNSDLELEGNSGIFSIPLNHDKFIDITLN